MSVRQVDHARLDDARLHPFQAQTQPAGLNLLSLPGLRRADEPNGDKPCLGTDVGCVVVWRRGVVKQELPEPLIQVRLDDQRDTQLRAAWQHSNLGLSVSAFRKVLS
jgi:hypothetical protein